MASPLSFRIKRGTTIKLNENPLVGSNHQSPDGRQTSLEDVEFNPLAQASSLLGPDLTEESQVEKEEKKRQRLKNRLLRATPLQTDKISEFSDGMQVKVMFADATVLGPLGISGKPLHCTLLQEDTWASLFSRCCHLVRERASAHVSSKTLKRTLFSRWNIQPVLPNGAVLPLQRRPEFPYECSSSGINRLVLISCDYEDARCTDQFPLKTHLFWPEIAPAILSQQAPLHRLIPLKNLPVTSFSEGLDDASQAAAALTGNNRQVLHIDTLVFEGGGVKGLAFPSALQVLSDAKLLSQVNQYAGTSAGSIAAVLLAVGFSVKELFQIMAKSDFAKFKDGQPSGSLALFKSYGLYKGDYFLGWIGELIKQKLGDADATFGDLYLRRRVTVVVTGTCLETRSTEYFHWMNFPEMPLRLAVRISMSIPLFFNAVKFRGCHWVDGGVLNNYPISIFDGVLIGDEKSRIAPPKPNILGLRLLGAEEVVTATFGHSHPSTPANKPQQQPIDGLVDLSQALITGMLDAIQTLRSKPGDADRTIPLNVGTIPSTQFQLNSSEQLQLIHAGTNAALEYLTCNRISPGVHTPMTWRLTIIRAQRLFHGEMLTSFNLHQATSQAKNKSQKKSKTKHSKSKFRLCFDLGSLHLQSRCERAAPEPTWTHELSLSEPLLFHRNLTFRLVDGDSTIILGRARLQAAFFDHPQQYFEPQLLDLPIEPAKVATDDSSGKLSLGSLSSMSASLITGATSSSSARLMHDEPTAQPSLVCTLQCVYAGPSNRVRPRKFLNPSVTRLHVCIESGHDLVSRDKNGLSDPYVVVTFQGQKKKTTTFNQTLEPYWDETLSFDVSFEISSWSIAFHVYDFDFGSKDDSMGYVEFQLANQAHAMAMSFPHSVDLPLQIAPNHSSKVSGFLRVTIDLDDTLTFADARSLKVLVEPKPWFARYFPDWDLTKFIHMTISIDSHLSADLLIDKIKKKIVMRVQPEYHAKLQLKLKKWKLFAKQEDGSMIPLASSESVQISLIRELVFKELSK